MILHTAPQGSPEWHAARAGVITASMFATCRQKLKSGPSKGEFAAAAGDYAFRLAVERISGQPLDEGFETWAMRRGHELEPAARLEHELAIGVVVQPAGFVTTDDNLFGASADGLIGEDGRPTALFRRVVFDFNAFDLEKLATLCALYFHIYASHKQANAHLLRDSPKKRVLYLRGFDDEAAVAATDTVAVGISTVDTQRFKIGRAHV